MCGLIGLKAFTVRNKHVSFILFSRFFDTCFHSAVTDFTSNSHLTDTVPFYGKEPQGCDIVHTHCDAGGFVSGTCVVPQLSIQLSQWWINTERPFIAYFARTPPYYITYFLMKRDFLLSIWFVFWQGKLEGRPWAGWCRPDYVSGWVGRWLGGVFTACDNTLPLLFLVACWCLSCLVRKKGLCYVNFSKLPPNNDWFSFLYMIMVSIDGVVK